MSTFTPDLAPAVRAFAAAAGRFGGYAPRHLSTATIHTLAGLVPAVEIANDAAQAQADAEGSPGAACISIGTGGGYGSRDVVLTYGTGRTIVGLTVRPDLSQPEGEETSWGCWVSVSASTSWVPSGPEDLETAASSWRKRQAAIDEVIPAQAGGGYVPADDQGVEIVRRGTFEDDDS